MDNKIEWSWEKPSDNISRITQWLRKFIEKNRELIDTFIQWDRVALLEQQIAKFQTESTTTVSGSLLPYGFLLRFDTMYSKPIFTTTILDYEKYGECMEREFQQFLNNTYNQTFIVKVQVTPEWLLVNVHFREWQLFSLFIKNWLFEFSMESSKKLDHFGFVRK